MPFQPIQGDTRREPSQRQLTEQPGRSKQQAGQEQDRDPIEQVDPGDIPTHRFGKDLVGQQQPPEADLVYRDQQVSNQVNHQRHTEDHSGDGNPDCFSSIAWHSRRSLGGTTGIFVTIGWEGRQILSLTLIIAQGGTFFSPRFLIMSYVS